MWINIKIKLNLIKYNESELLSMKYLSKYINKNNHVKYAKIAYFILIQILESQKNAEYSD